MHTWFRSIWVLREPFLVEEHCTGTIWPFVSEHSHFHTTGHPLVNKIHYLSYSDHRLKTIMSNIIVIRFHRGSCLSATKVATPIWRCEPAVTHNLAIMETFTCVLQPHQNTIWVTMKFVVHLPGHGQILRYKETLTHLVKWRCSWHMKFRSGFRSNRRTTLCMTTAVKVEAALDRVDDVAGYKLMLLVTRTTDNQVCRYTVTDLQMKVASLYDCHTN